MLSSVFLQASSVERILAGPIGAHAEAFARRLGSVGYQGKTVQKYVSIASHFGGWLRKHKIEFEDVDETTILAFRRHLPKCRCPEWYHGRPAFNGKSAVTTARHFLEYLRAEGMARPRVAPPVPPLMAEFSSWLRQRQSVGEKTINDYCRHSQALLATIEGVESLDARAVRAFIMAESRKYCRGYVVGVITAIKAFIRFLTVTGRCSSNLKDAIPKIAQWRLATLPRYLHYDDIERLIASCDRSTAIGLRDRAILLLLARLALRAGDVRTLRLSDIDWKRGSIVVSGKTPHEVRMPLPQEVGDAILDYLNRGRPKADSPFIFLRSIPPFRSLNPAGMQGVSRRAFNATGVKTHSLGTHVFRHSAATEMLRRGASLDQVRTVLRHTCAESTLQYAKVDINALKEIAQPWPEVPPC